MTEEEYKDIIVQLSQAYEEDNYDEAEALTDKLLAADEHSTPAYYYKGLIEDARENYAAAEAHYKKVIDLEPEAKQMRYVLATNLLDQGKVDEAEALMQEIEEDDTVDFYEITELKSLLLLARGDKAGALNTIDAAIKIADEDDREDLEELREIVDNNEITQ